MNNVININDFKPAKKQANRDRIQMIADRMSLARDIECAEHELKCFQDLSKTMENPADRFVARTMAKEKEQELVLLKELYTQLVEKIEA